MVLYEKVSSGMRLGINPYKRELGKGTAYKPSEITVGMLSFIPSFSGYFREKFDILKISLSSIIKNTSSKFDLLVFDNGSCDEVVEYLMQLNSKNIIDYLILSKNNLGVYGGTEAIFNSAPGKIIAYTQDDIFFHPGWLNRSLKILDNYPDVGFVCGCPVRHLFNIEHANHSLIVPSIYQNINVIKGQWDEQFDEIYALSTGGNPIEYKSRYGDKNVPLYSLNGIKAYPTGAHFQFIIKKEVAKKVLPFPFTGNTMGGTVNDVGFRFTDVFDKVLNDMRYAKYCTDDIYTEHLGNVICPRTTELINQYSLNIGNIQVTKSCNDRLTFLQKIIVLIFKMPLMRVIPNRIVRFMEKVSYWKKLYSI
jgi:glycosyltransferase involved in cell wall biosynthesis